MRMTISFHPDKDKDIIEYIGGQHKTYKVREAIRKAIQFDKWMEKVLSRGLNAEIPKEEIDIDGIQKKLDDVKIETSDEVPQMSEEEINKKLDEQF